MQDSLETALLPQYEATPTSTLDTDTSTCLVTVIVPTFREVENLPILVPQVANHLADAGISFEIVVVDDNSQDGTDAACAKLAASFPLRLLVRTQDRGLSSAVLHGMRHARGSLFVVMDADLSHPPEKVPDLVKALQTDGADFVIGSRYTPGGGTDENWGLFRWLNSKFATLLAWPLTSTHDPMAGFFAIRRATFEAAAPLDPIGYKIGLELIVKCRCQAIKEVPISFRDRVLGQSKLNFKEQLNYLRHLKRLYDFRFGAWAQLFQFICVGSTGMIVDMLVFALLLLFLPETLARGFAIWTAMTWNFFPNRKVTFSQGRARSIGMQYVLFCMSCTLGSVVSWLTWYALYTAIPMFDGHPLLAAPAGIVTGTAFNFLLSKHLVFK
ncbi:MAG TPA: glycosyltransferase family 2 protein [Gemmataceae bacterium]|nr:glycosyltransferase family 2 protein [Gemmataceae bacterium]